MRRRVLAMTLVFLLAGIPLPARPAGMASLRVVTQASGAHFNSSTVSAGATVYDGDLLSTEADGALQFRCAAASLYLPGQSGVKMHGLPKGNQAQLRAGTLVFSTAKAADLEVLADDAFIRPAADGPTAAQVSVVGPKELRITARHGTLEFSYRGESEKIAEGATYRVLLDPPESYPSPPQRQPPSYPDASPKSSRLSLSSLSPGQPNGASTRCSKAPTVRNSNICRLSNFKMCA